MTYPSNTEETASCICFGNRSSLLKHSFLCMLISSVGDSGSPDVTVFELEEVHVICVSTLDDIIVAIIINYYRCSIINKYPLSIHMSIPEFIPLFALLRPLNFVFYFKISTT